MQFPDVRPHCPVCDSTRTSIDEQPAELWHYHILECCCLQCDATFEVVYSFVRVQEVRYGNPLGPVCLTDHAQQAPEERLMSYASNRAAHLAMAAHRQATCEAPGPDGRS